MSIVFRFILLVMLRSEWLNFLVNDKKKDLFISFSDQDVQKH